MDEIKRVDFKNFKKHPLLKRFLQISDPPKQIFYRGEFPSEDLKFLTIVGSRNITSYGKSAIEKILEGLAGYPVCIISGLALGVDGIAHENALKNNILTICFPGSGISDKSLYPKTNIKIAGEILKSGGMLIGEYPPENKPSDYIGKGGQFFSFPARNRLMAGISDAVLIVEGAEKSGTMITARLATEYNKDLLAIPGSIFSANSYLPNSLIKDGAVPITCAEDILNHFRIKIKSEEKIVKNSMLPDNLTETEKNILQNLNEPISKDSLHNKLNLEIGVFLTTITILEMKGIIKEEMGIISRIR